MCSALRTGVHVYLEGRVSTYEQSVQSVCMWGPCVQSC